MTASARELEIEQQDGVAVWTLNRPARRNALSAALLEQLDTAIERASRNSRLRAVVLTGCGEAAFCAGADLVERRGMDEARVRELLKRTNDVFSRLDALPCPVIAALNGVAAGGGLELALCCDLRVADPHVRLGLPETRLAIIPGAGGTQRLPRLIGLSWAKQMILLGELWDAPRALAVGLVHQVADEPGGALAQALRWAEALRAGAPLAQRAALEALDGGAGLPLAQGLELERRCYERTLVSEDRREALAAFAEKRTPRFKGR